MRLCLEEMAPDLHGAVVRAQEEAVAEEAGARAGWEAHVPELAPVGIVYAPIAEQECLIRQAPLATT